MKTLLFLTLLSTTTFWHSLWASDAPKINYAYVDQDGRFLMFTRNTGGFLGDSEKAKTCVGCTNYATLGYSEMMTELGTTLGKGRLSRNQESSDPKSSGGFSTFKCSDKEVKFRALPKADVDVLNERVSQGKLKLENLPEPKYRMAQFLLKDSKTDLYIYGDYGTGFDKTETTRIYIIRDGKSELLEVTSDASYLDGGSRSVSAKDSKGVMYSIDIPASNKRKPATVNYNQVEKIENKNITEELIKKLGIDSSEYDISKIINNNPCTEANLEAANKAAVDSKEIFDSKRDVKPVQKNDSKVSPAESGIVIPVSGLAK